MTSSDVELASVQPLTSLEQRLVRYVAAQPEALSRRIEDSLRYAINLARVGPVRLGGGLDLQLTGPLEAFRGWLLDVLGPPMRDRKAPDIPRLIALEPAVLAQAGRARNQLLTHFGNQLSAERLDAEVGHKHLVLVLGGGGGAGFAHLGAFTLLHEIGWDPSLIVGASMGGLLGLFRAMRRSWDPVGTLLSLPRRFDFQSLFEPFRGSTRFGFPGAIALHLRDIARMTFELFNHSPIPSFGGLSIPLEVVVTGVSTGMKPVIRRLGMPQRTPSTLTGLFVRRRVARMFRIVRALASNPRFLHELVFGRDQRTRQCSVIDAVGFSCAVPGLFCYDLAEDTDSQTVAAVESLFAEHGLWGLTDGGVVNNVPSRVAWESVQEGTITSRNAFIYALDPFAPRFNANIAFMPVQQIAHRGVTANQRYSDLHRTYARPPAPHRLALGWSRLRAVIETTRSDLERDKPYLESMRRTLTPFERLAATS